MAVRKIVQIDESKCNGCGLCAKVCHEGAIEIIDGKAKLVSDIYCDGLGDCLGECPLGAVTIIEREAADFDEEAVKVRMEEMKKPAHAQGHTLPCGCPGSASRMFEQTQETAGGVKIPSALRHWPVQLKLVPVNAPYFEGAELLVCADCVPFAFPNFHQELLAGKSVVVACPKLDDIKFYVDKLTEIFKQNNLKQITVARMEVPCCGGLLAAVRQALVNSGEDIPVADRIINIRN